MRDHDVKEPSVGARPTPEAKTERLLNLVIALLYTRRPLSKDAIRSAVRPYAEAPNDEAFDRMFERDKDELRELGIPLRTEQVDVLFEDEVGYRIDRREYELPDLHFDADELAVLGLASRAWQQASLAGPAAAALRKLEALDIEHDASSIVGLEPRIRTPEPAFDAIKDAVMTRRAVSFTYRTRGLQETRRHLQPWTVTNRKGHWYVTGFDTDRDAPRVFRLSRIEGEVRFEGRAAAYDVPADHDARGLIAQSERSPDWAPAVLRVRVERGHSLVRRARTVGMIDDDWQLIDLEYADLADLADEIVSFGADVLVEKPDELRDAVVARLRGTLDAQSPAGPVDAEHHEGQIR